MQLESNEVWNTLIERVSELVSQASGNVLGERQKTMVENRLRNRMLEHGFQQPEKYRSYLESHLHVELGHLVSLITTHHTFFFREFIHFDFLKTNLTSIINNVRKEKRQTIRVWSAACSRGHEVYSLAMFMHYHMKTLAPDLDFTILGTDIDCQSLSVAENGVYHWNEIKSIPAIYQENNWQRGKGAISDFVKIKKRLKEKCQFKTINLINSNEWPVGNFDIIFCRNVFIYFSADVVERLANHFVKQLNINGYFFSGISESLAHYNVKAISVGSSVYMDIKNKVIRDSEAIISSNQNRVIRVLCVDDSPSMLKIYKKILTVEHGFDVVAVAKNGKEAEEIMSSETVDIMTLDIHMPIMDGIAYLEKNYSYRHIPVVIISSVSRNDSSLAVKAMSLGVSDFIEKPELKNITQVGEEVRTKLKVAYIEQKNRFTKLVDNEFKVNYEITDLKSKVQLIVATFRDLAKLENYLNDFQSGLPASIILYHGQDELFREFLNELKKLSILSLEELVDQKISANNIYVINYQKYFQNYIFSFSTFDLAILLFGRISESYFNEIKRLPNKYIILEDLQEDIGDKYLQSVDEVTPCTSFSYIIKKYFSRSI